MQKEQVMGFIRHALTFIGGAMVAKGLADDGQVAELTGSIMSVVGVIWSIVAKKA